MEIIFLIVIATVKIAKLSLSKHEDNNVFLLIICFSAIHKA